MNEQQINQLSKEIFEFNKSVGWWDDMDLPIFQVLQLVSKEIAEATEGARKNLMDKYLPHRKSEEVGLADALIRILDFGGRYNLVFSKYPTVNFQLLKNAFPEAWGGRNVASAHFIINIILSELGLFFYSEQDKGGVYFIDGSNRIYSSLIESVIYTAQKYNYDLFGALKEKFEFNKTRADHKRENRAKEHGKKF